MKRILSYEALVYASKKKLTLQQEFVFHDGPWSTFRIVGLPLNKWLVVSTTLKNISQIGSFFQVGVKIENIWNHHLDNLLLFAINCDEEF